MGPIDSALQSVFKLSGFRPRQREIVEDVLAGNDVLAIMPTGAGKSLCYQLPAVVTRGLTLVVSPLISLMADQARELRALGIPVIVLNSSQDREQQRESFIALNRGFHGLLYIAPERLFASGFQRTLESLDVKLLVIDEAHCVSQWGHDFRPEYTRIAEARRLLGSPTTIALTATATPETIKDIARMLELREPKLHVTSFDRPNLRFSAKLCKTDADKDAELLRVVARHRETGIIYCSTRRAAEQIAALLGERLPKRTVSLYHAGMTQSQRQRSQHRFMQADDAIVVATNAFGMGINKAGVRFVIHYNLPGSLEAYYQEAGRAGRDGGPADCVLLHNERDLRTQRFFITTMGDNNPELTGTALSRAQRLREQKLEKMLAYAERRDCRRVQLIRYFGEDRALSDCHCDGCVPTKSLAPAGARSESPARSHTSHASVAPPARKKTNGKGPDDLYEQLRAVRSQLAKEEDLPAFCILHDKTLQEIARLTPLTIEEFVAIHGIGAKKAEKYARHFIAAIRSSQSGAPGHSARNDDAPREASAASATAGTARPASRATSATGPAVEQRPSTRQIQSAMSAGGGDTSVDPQVLSRLQEVRAGLARENNFPPYFIVHNAALEAIARHRPASLDQLAAISGIGDKRAEKWGKALLAALAL